MVRSPRLDELAVRAAVAVAGNARCVLYTPAENKLDMQRWVDVREAVEAGEPYAVPVRGFVALDIDANEAALQAVLQMLDDRGADYIQLDSHGGGPEVADGSHSVGRHILVAEPNRWAAQQLADAIKDRFPGGSGGVDVKQYLRPPLAWHRNGRNWSTPVGLTPEEAVEWLERHAARVPDSGLPPSVSRLVAGTAPATDLRDRSNALVRVASQAYRRWWDLRRFKQLTFSGPIEDRLQEEDARPGGRERYLETVWSWVRSNPGPEHDRETAAKEAAAWLEGAQRHTWGRRTQVLRTAAAVSEIMAEHGRTSMDLSIRDIGKRSGLPPSTTSKHLKYLDDAGFIGVRAGARRYESRHVSLVLETSPVREHTLEERSVLGVSTLGGDLAPARILLRPEFLPGALGATNAEVSECFDDTPRTKTEAWQTFVSRYGCVIAKRTFENKVADLVRAGVLERHGHRYTKNSAFDGDAVSVRSPKVETAAELMRHRADEQAEEQRRFHASRAQWTLDKTWAEHGDGSPCPFNAVDARTAVTADGEVVALRDALRAISSPLGEEMGQLGPARLPCPTGGQCGSQF